MLETFNCHVRGCWSNMVVFFSPCPSGETSIPCLTFMCLLRLPFRLNLLEQHAHLKGLLPAWRCMWPRRLYIRLNDFPHTCGKRIKRALHTRLRKCQRVGVKSILSLTLHLKGFTGRCTIMWVLRVCFWTKDLKHTWHWNGRTLAWINMCLFRFADNVNSRAHTSHLNPFVP